MRTLAIDSATAACSVALFDGRELVAGEWRELGRGHAEYLVPMIAALPERGRADRIVVSRGPGSFTGVRIGLAAARALGLAWSVDVLGYPTLALIAAMARAESGNHRIEVTACMAGGHGEWFVQHFNKHGLPEQDFASLAPDEAVRAGAHSCIAGSKAREFAAMLPDQSVAPINILPDAQRAMLLPPALMSDELSPIYGRAPDAKLPNQLPATP